MLSLDKKDASLKERGKTFGKHPNVVAHTDKTLSDDGETSRRPAERKSEGTTKLRSMCFWQSRVMPRFLLHLAQQT